MMTVQELQALGLEEDAAAAVFGAWQDELESGRREREQTEKSLLIREALRGRGASEGAARMLTREVDADRVTVEGGRITGDDGQLAQLVEAYGGLFRGHAPLRPVAPPKPEASALSRDAIAGMTAEEINRHWEEIRDALRG